MKYALVQFETGVLAFQESLDGQVQRYCDFDGVTLEGYPPECSAEIVDANPAILEWMNA